MPLPLAEFQSRLLDSGILTADHRSTLDTLLASQSAPASGDDLARLLVNRKILTAYQAQAIYQGKGKQLVLGNYLVLDKLGQGGMGLVLKARHRRMDRLVALKVVSPAVVKTKDLLSRFQREVKAAARLSHPNIVTSHDADEVKGTHFLVMEYVEGTDLGTLVRQQGMLPVATAIDYILQAARGLDYSHRQGIVHRDIKPANLLVNREGTVKILDMGLARIEAASQSAGELTSTGAVMGTADYMSPEQAFDSKSADSRADQYSLGCTLFYLLTAQHVYAGESLMEKLLRHREAPIPSLRKLRPEVPPALDAIFQRLMAKQPGDRYASMSQVVEEVSRQQRSSTAAAPAAPGLSEDSRLNDFLAGLAAQKKSPAASASPQPASPAVAVLEPKSISPDWRPRSRSASRWPRRSPPFHHPPLPRMPAFRKVPLRTRPRPGRPAGGFPEPG